VRAGVIVQAFLGSFELSSGKARQKRRGILLMELLRRIILEGGRRSVSNEIGQDFISEGRIIAGIELVPARFEHCRYEQLSCIPKRGKLGEAIAYIVFKISLFEKCSHSRKRAYYVLNVFLKDFVSTKERGGHEITVPKRGVGQNIGTVGDDSW